MLPASALNFYSCQHLRWTFIAASIRAGLLLVASTSSLTASVSCWTCLGLMPSHGLTGSFSFWSADSFRGPSPGTLFFIVSWTLLGGPQTLFLFSVDSSSMASLRAGLYFVVVTSWTDGQQQLNLLRASRDAFLAPAISHSR